jgi:hypothetical protein
MNASKAKKEASDAKAFNDGTEKHGFLLGSSPFTLGSF